MYANISIHIRYKRYKNLIKKEYIMNSNDYVLNHDFGYLEICDDTDIKKLKLRNHQDLLVYVNDIFNTQFVGKYINNCLYFADNTIVQINVEQI